jgi:integrase
MTMKTQEAVEKYIAFRRSHDDAAPGYVNRLEKELDRMSKFFPDLGDVTSKSFETYQLWLREQKTYAGFNTKWATVARHASYMKGLLAWATEEEVIKRPAPELWFPSRKQQEREAAYRRSMDVSERDRFLARLEEVNRESARWYTVAFFSAMRKSEIDSMTLRWLDFQRERICIPARNAKSGTDDGAIHLHPRAAQAIREQVGDVTVADKNRPIFGKRDRRLHYEKAIIMAVIDPAGLPETHMTRHTRATQLAEKGGLLAVQRQLRHKHATTSSKYVHAAFDHAKRANLEAP